MSNKRKDSKGRILHTGESQRKDGTYDYRYTDSTNKRHSIYAPTLEELRMKEEEILCKFLGECYNYEPTEEEIGVMDAVFHTGLKP